MAGAFIDNDDEPKHVRLLLQCIHLKLGHQLLRCSSIGQFDQLDQLALELVERIDPAASVSDAHLFEDYEFCLVPLTNIFVTKLRPTTASEVSDVFSTREQMPNAAL
jgi:hypothetical protein